ncbi:hypothetical protein [Campylobacter gracilis]|uniref:hypothetical protein n=1 Tax=Campylobacter gracilis TaxID=824 RepID=UPI0012E206D2|nr:hypothetical protein [Campylobacter gracilis]UEB44647.1 hypothetical protein LK410_06370 [Campylobacter gracilis]
MNTPRITAPIVPIPVHKLSVNMKNMRSRLISKSSFSAIAVSRKTIKSTPSPVYRTYASTALCI